MILYLLLGLCIGIEGGYMFPASGFQDINSGAGFSVFAGRKAGFADLALSIRAAHYRGDNPGYAMSTLGCALDAYKRTWPITPVLMVGADYLRRTMDETSEAGFAASYALGARVNFNTGPLYIYPEVRYAGSTDLEVHAGFIEVKLGIGYEI